MGRPRTRIDRDTWLEYRVRRLPEQLRRARHRVAQLESEARFLRMDDLLTDTAHVDKAWDKEVAAAYAAGTGGKADGQ